MLAYWWTVGRHICGPTVGHMYWSNVLAIVTKGNTDIIPVHVKSLSLPMQGPVH